MPGHLKALVVILVLAAIVFAFAKTPASAVATNASDFVRRRNLWFGVTLAGFFKAIPVGVRVSLATLAVGEILWLFIEMKRSL